MGVRFQAMTTALATSTVVAVTTAVVGATTAGSAAAAEPALTRSSTIIGVGAPAVAAPTDALTELRRARAAMLVTDDAPYAGAIPWRIPRPDRIQVVGDPWDEVSHPCREATYAQLGGEAFRNRILVSDTATSYDASVEEDVLLFPDAATATSAYDQLATELTTCQERLAETGADLPITYVGDVADPNGGRGTVWNADFATSDPEFLEDMTAAVVQRGRAIAVISVNRYGTLTTYDPAAALPTAQAALTRLGYFD